MKVIAVIPAKGQSTGVPGKNIKMFHGKPLILHTIECARAATKFGSNFNFERIVVSTDNPEVADIASEHVDSVIMRPGRLCGDGPSLPIFAHAVDLSERHFSEEYDWAMLLQPTSPLRAPQDIAMALEIAHKSHATSVTSVSEIKRGRKVYQTNGSIYLVRRDVLKASLFGDNPQLVLIPPERAIDIDTPADWAIAEALYGGGIGGSDQGRGESPTPKTYQSSNA